MSLSLALATVLAASTPAQEAPPSLEVPRGVRLGVDLDPLVFAFGGYGADLRVSLPGHPQLRILLAAAGSMGLPQAAVDQTAGNEGWGATMDYSLGVAFVYHLRPARGGFLATAELALQQWTLSAPTGGEAISRQLAPLAFVGYQWFPFDGLGLYAVPYAGLGYFAQLNGPPRVGSSEYKFATVQPMVALHLGYEWQL